MLTLLRHGARSAAPAFLPTNVAGLKFWTRADALVLNNLDPVSTWVDESGVGNNWTQAAAARPTYKTGGPNGKPYVSLDGVDDSMATAALAGTTWFAAAAATIFAVYKQPATTSVVKLFSWGTNSVTNSASLFGAFSDNNFYFDYGDETLNAARVSGAQPAGWDDNWHVVILQRTATNQRITVDGTNVVSAAVTDNLDFPSASALLLGNEGGVSGAFDIAEFGIYNVAISAGDETSLKNYLAGKYGITVV